MGYVGVDLAWGPKNPTGLAALDDQGRLVTSGTVLTDQQVLQFISDHLGSTGVVAVDAPLIVPNDAGQRLAENLIGHTFGAYNASAHPANRSRPYFRPPRAATLTEQLGLEIDPAVEPGQGRRVCIEVYPHPATIALFRLDTIIPYKNKPGRTLETLRSAHLQLLDLMEERFADLLGLAANQRWQHIRHAVNVAARKSELKTVEDETDAILCACLAWMWDRQHDQMQAFGNVNTGYIVSPTLPADAPPPRRPTASTSVVASPGGGSDGPLTGQADVAARPAGARRPNSRSSQGATVQIGYTNPNRQSVIEATGVPGTDHGQSIYVLRCGNCGNEYGSNGSDNHLRRCPACQRGRPGLTYR